MANELVSIERLSDFHADITVDAHILKRSTAYAVDKIVNKGFVYLKCTQAGTTASTALSLSGISVGDELTDGTAKWKVISVDGIPEGGTGSGIAIWATSTLYKVDDMVLYNDVIYKCNTQHTSSTFSADASKWDFVNANIQDWQATTFYKQGATVIYNHKLYQCVTEHTSTSSWDESKWQLIGDYVTAPIKIGEVGYISWQYSLMDNHLALNGGTVNDFQATYPELYDFFEDNNLITTVQADYDANHALLLYDSSTDTATMPNFLSKTLWGGSTVEEKSAGLPNIKGECAPSLLTSPADTGGMGISAVSFSGAFSARANITNRPYYVSDGTNIENTDSGIKLDASTYNSIYSDSVNTVQPPAIQLIPQIRYKKDTIEGSVGDFYNDTPIGTVISYMGTTAPREYLACDGTVYNISTYQALADYINDTFGSYNYFGGDGITTFAVPDLRGEFLRGTGTNSHANQGSGDSVGVHQDATSFNNAEVSSSSKLSQYWGASDWSHLITTEDSRESSNSRVMLTASAGSIDTSQSYTNAIVTARPTNTSVLYCIKYTVAIVPKSIVDWQTSTEYEIGNIVIYDNIMYKCLSDHTSGTFATDYANGKWQEIDETATTAQIEALFI